MKDKQEAGKILGFTPLAQDWTSHPLHQSQNQISRILTENFGFNHSLTSGEVLRPMYRLYKVNSQNTTNMVQNFKRKENN